MYAFTKEPYVDVTHSTETDTFQAQEREVPQEDSDSSKKKVDEK